MNNSFKIADTFTVSNLLYNNYLPNYINKLSAKDAIILESEISKSWIDIANCVVRSKGEALTRLSAATELCLLSIPRRIGWNRSWLYKTLMYASDISNISRLYADELI